MPDGLLVIDKPEGPTSHDVVARARRVLDERRIGHTGTLDPLATGVLPLLLGRATRLAQFLTADDKRYVAEIRLGEATTTYDRQGEVAGPVVAPYDLTREAVEAVLERFRGTLMQVPPPYSAKKVGGVSAHRLARRGAPPVLAAVRVTVRELTLLELAGPDLRVDLACSAGFYVRSLAHDLGTALGCGGHLRSLRRTASGTITLEGAVSLAELEARPETARRAIQPLSALLAGWAAVRVTASGAAKVRQGAYLGPADCESWDASASLSSQVDAPAVCVRVLDQEGNLMALAAWVWLQDEGSQREGPQRGDPQRDDSVQQQRTSDGLPFLHPRVVLV